MVRVEIMFDSRNIVDGFLEASLQFEKGIEKTVMWYLFSKIIPSLFTLKEGSTSHPDPLTLRGEGGNRPTRCSGPLRSKVGGPSKGLRQFLRDGTAWRQNFYIMYPHSLKSLLTFYK